MSLRTSTPARRIGTMVQQASRPLRVAFFVYPGIQALDLSGPLELFARATRLLRDERKPHPGYAPVVVGTEEGPIAGSSGFRFLPDTIFRDVRSGIDTLLVVGGLGVDSVVDDPEVLEWLRKISGRVRRLGSVCPGAFLLAEAGLPRGRPPTTPRARPAGRAPNPPPDRARGGRPLGPARGPHTP